MLPRSKTDLLLIGIVIASAAAWAMPEYRTLILVAGLLLFVLYAGTVSGPGYALEPGDTRSEYSRRMDARGGVPWGRVVELGFWFLVLVGPSLAQGWGRSYI